MSDHTIHSLMSARGFPHNGTNGTARLSRAVKLHVAADPKGISEARRSLDPLEDQLEPELLKDMRLLVSELVTNSVRHGTASASDRVEVEVALSHELVRVSVIDGGRGFEVNRRNEHTDPGSGWGLFLVDQLAHRWGVQVADRTEVWFELLRELPRAA